ncbi:MAG: hypothetical protein U0169_18420 [Polyangiaceae bacterium]
MKKTLLPALLTLVIGFVAGYFIGRTKLQNEWSEPYMSSAPATAATDSNPAPLPGTKVLRPMPIGKSRSVLKQMTEKDPIATTSASVGQGEEGVELHVALENRGKCTVNELSGVAYGFDPYGKPSPLQANGATYVAFDLKGTLEPGKKALAAQKLQHVELATLAVAHVDKVKCADGTAWARQ